MAQQHLFSPLTLRGLVLRNRIGVSPMCQYSSMDGFATDWHLAHLGARAVGGAALVMMEATAVSPEGRITPACNGIWDDAHVPQLKKITDFIKSTGAVPAIQLAHAGRKASSHMPWEGGGQITPSSGGWQTLAPSALSFSPGQVPPRAMMLNDIENVRRDFVAGALRAVQAGFQVIEIHAAHGYLLHSFFSPLSNVRSDDYGGGFENRARFLLETFEEVRRVLPQEIAVGVRLSCSDWKEGGIGIDDAVRLSALLAQRGCDFIDCSSGGAVPDAKVQTGPGYQVPFAEKIKKETGIMTFAVGMITEPAQADAIIREGRANMVFLARALLYNPHWPLHAAQKLGHPAPVPVQYLRGF